MILIRYHSHVHIISIKEVKSMHKGRVKRFTAENYMLITYRRRWIGPANPSIRANFSAKSADPQMFLQKYESAVLLEKWAPKNIQ